MDYTLCRGYDWIRSCLQSAFGFWELVSWFKAADCPGYEQDNEGNILLDTFLLRMCNLIVFWLSSEAKIIII